ncbi:hypothetical protein G7Y89_g5872 [Cudoniella acicularis]|uniref:Uncharacterized protein n=1 Tax=Cudoniella acicularis TaxID=354080 RepID=A0A8H4RLL7_9HELO|nr:hypothetical protein G7Y89_g5872 [Cudoniella acicularis]
MNGCDSWFELDVECRILEIRVGSWGKGAVRSARLRMDGYRGSITCTLTPRLVGSVDIDSTFQYKIPNVLHDKTWVDL